MQSLHDYTRGKCEIRLLFGASFAFGCFWTGLLFFSNLYAHPFGINTPVMTEIGSVTPARATEGALRPFEPALEMAFVPAVPAVPGGLTATTVSNTRIDLAWTDNSSDENGFKIEVKIDSSGTYTQLATVGTNVTSYSSTGLDAGTQYFYRVRAYNANGNSGYSNEASASTLPDLPTAPSGLTATAVSNTQINLTWADNSTTEDGFKIERKLSSAITYTQIATVGANVTSYSSTGLTASTAYSYRVRAFNTGGNSSYSNVASATTSPNPPAAPSGLAATAVSNTQINLTWTDNSTTEDGFKIERKLSSATTYTQIATVGANVTSYSSTGMTANTAYSFRVRAYNTGGNSSYSNVASATTLPNPPAAPSGLAAAAVSNRRINLSWQDNAKTELGFIIARKTGAGGAYAVIDTVSADVTTYASTGLTGSTQYFYKVRAYNASGNSLYSNEADATTHPDPPAAPSNLTASAVSSDQINLAWTDNAANEEGFKIEIKIGSSGTYTQIATVGANVTSYSSTGLEASTQYFYRVRAYSVNGNSSYSNAASATTLQNPPATPSGLAATALSSTQINLTWTDNATNEDGFKIERKLNSAVTYTQIATVGANVTSYSSTSLAVNTTYSYRVRAFNTGGNSSYSNVASATTLPNPPAAPSGLAATAVNNGQIDLAWTDNSNTESGFKIERKIGAAGTFAEIATVEANVTSYSNAGLTGSTQYYYQVRAYNGGGNSAYSNAATATTPPDPPTAPSNLTATAVANDQINLAWTDNASNEDGFNIEVKIGASGTYTQIESVTANVTSYSSTGLDAGTQYSYRVRAFNTTDNSSYSNEANATTLPDPPAAPSGLTATTVSNTKIKLTWADNATNEEGFTIERKLSSAAAYTEIDTVAANVTSYSNAGLSPNTAYSYRVRAFNTGGNSSYSNAASAKTLPNPPAAPSGLAATTVSSSRIDLSWQDNSTNESDFKIERKTGTSGVYAAIDTVSANVTTYSNTGLSPNTKYFYRVRAHNAGGNSIYSNEASATTKPLPPAKPSNLIATAVGGWQINLTWTDNSANESGFKIERKLSSAVSYTQFATVGANVTSFSDTSGLSPNTEYSYRARAYNAGGNSAYSNEMSATTMPDLPPVPSGLTATTVSSARINLTWMDKSANESGFKIERKTGSAGTYTQIAIVGANLTSYSSTGLTAGTKYFYRVRAYNASGNSVYSNEASATTLLNPPVAPSNLTATTVSSSQIDLAWADSAKNENGFKIERKTGAAGTYAQIAIAAANVTSFADTGLIVNTTYFYRVRAYNTGGNSAYSNETNATTLSGGNLALNKPTTASSTDSTSTPSRAVDGSTGTYWRSGPVNATTPIAWLRVKLSLVSSVPVARAVLTWNQNYFANEYEIQVSNDDATWTTVYTNNFGTSNTQDVTFTPTTAKYVRLYLKKNYKSNYRVAELEIYSSASKAFSGATANEAIVPDKIFLAQNYPNPFNPATTIRFGLKEAGVVRLSIYNLQGQEVRTLISGQMSSGEHAVNWDGKDDHGRLAPSGTYLYKLWLNGFEQTKKMALVK